MAYWWVFQGDSYKRSRAGGYLWAPKEGQDGRTRMHWSNMERVCPGDIIFSGCDQRLVAVSCALRPAEDAAPPDPKDLQKWPKRGWRIPISFQDLEAPIPYSRFVADLLPLLQEKHSPFSRHTGQGNLGYLFELPMAAGEMLAGIISKEHPYVLVDSVTDQPRVREPQVTSRPSLIDARNGQGQFRNDLIGYWQGQCAVSTCRRLEILRASHIRPWSASNDFERLDVFNGLLLSAAYDAAFDARLISFEDDGTMLVAADVSKADLAAAGILLDARLHKIDPRHLPYLRAHRELFVLRMAKKQVIS